MSMALTLDYSFWIPFLFIFAIIFGALSFSNPFRSRPVALAISLSLSLFSAFYTPLNATLWQYMPSLIWFFILVFFVGFVAKMLGMGGKKGEGSKGGPGPAAIAFLLLLTCGWSILQIPELRGFEIPLIGGGENIIFLFGFLFILALFYGAMKIGPGEAPPKEEKKG